MCDNRSPVFTDPMHSACEMQKKHIKVMRPEGIILLLESVLDCFSAASGALIIESMCMVGGYHPTFGVGTCTAEPRMCIARL